MTYQELQLANAQIAEESKFIDTLLDTVHRVVVGQTYMVERLLVGLLADGHVLLEGVPGLAKTLTVSTLAQCIGTKFQRIQFTPDLLPADLVGTVVYNQKTADFFIKKGPLFANIILADEINRTPAKVQSALLEAMQERQVTIGETTFKLEQPFLVLATQNPIEQEGTYPLPEAQVDRFMMKIKVGYPTREEELEIMRRMARTGEKQEITPVISPQHILRARHFINNLILEPKVEQYIIDLVFATREPAKIRGLKELATYIDFGGSPRATINLNLAARAYAFLQHRAYVTPDDVKAIAMDVLRHRVITSYEAEAEDITSEAIIQRILDTVEVP